MLTNFFFLRPKFYNWVVVTCAVLLPNFIICSSSSTKFYNSSSSFQFLSTMYKDFGLLNVGICNRRIKLELRWKQNHTVPNQPWLNSNYAQIKPAVKFVTPLWSNFASHSLLRPYLASFTTFFWIRDQGCLILFFLFQFIYWDWYSSSKQGFIEFINYVIFLFVIFRAWKIIANAVILVIETWNPFLPKRFKN
jgi:hypothetical protein